MKNEHLRNNSIKLRNFSESCDKHDVIKTLLCRMLRRKHRSKNVSIFTEYSPINQNNEYPDICMITRKFRKGKLVDEIVIYEIQKEISTSWTKQITKKYEDFDLIIVPTKELSDNIEELKKQLEVYVV